MFDGETNFRYDNRPLSDILSEQAPTPPKFSAHNDFTVYVMGPYTAFDAERAYDDADKLRTPFQDDPLFDPDRHVTDAGKGDMERALRDFCAELRDRHNCRAFIATDIDIPTHEQAANRNETRRDGEPAVEGVDPLAQSVAFAAHSDAVLFLFTRGGLTTGVGAETGGILGEFHLRRGNPALTHKPGQRIGLYLDEHFSSATIDELPKGYDVQYDSFRSKRSLHRKVRNWFDSLDRETRDTDLPVFVPGETYASDADD
ncbi:DUF7509 family protein [Natronorubrum halophilum]|uniref:DUF7509 family protein n=1 Tax=Natronorubrum halophilum TaxID=1702106 RepID=UPI0010C18956|nr:hypothetical protein [Natronorubrum halophilum]